MIDYQDAKIEAVTVQVKTWGKVFRTKRTRLSAKAMRALERWVLKVAKRHGFTVVGEVEVMLGNGPDPLSLTGGLPIRFDVIADGPKLGLGERMKSPPDYRPFQIPGPIQWPSES